MTLSVETLLIVSLMMAVFAAVSTVGSSLFLGAGFERLRAGFESIKKQTAFFSDAIHTLDGRVEGLEKQSGYFFQAIGELEHKTANAMPDDIAPVMEKNTLVAAKDDALHTQTDSLLSGMGFISEGPKASLSEQFGANAEKQSPLHFH